MEAETRGKRNGGLHCESINDSYLLGLEPFGVLIGEALGFRRGGPRFGGGGYNLLGRLLACAANELDQIWGPHIGLLVIM